MRQTAKKRVRAAAILLLLCLLLSACSAQMPAHIQEKLYGTPTGRQAAKELVPFEEMVYVRPDLEQMQQMADQAKALLEEGDPEAVVAQLRQCDAAYFNFRTMQILAEIRFYQDLTDSDYEAEYDFCTQNQTAAEQISDTLYAACAQSELASQLESLYFGEGFVDYYGGDYTGYADETYVSLLQQEQALLSQYRAEIADPTVELDGQTVHYNEAQTQDLDEAGYTALQRAYYDKYTQVLGEIYLELVQVRNTLADYLGYDGYEDYAFSVLYSREYTMQQADALAQDIRTEIAPLYPLLLQQLGAQERVHYEAADEAALRTQMAQAAQQMGGQIAEVWQTMDAYHLYDITVSAKKANTSFEDYLEDYEVPFALVKTWGYNDDIFAFAHEFGHCVDAYVNYNDTYSLELSETFSQAMEYLILSHVDDAQNLRAMRLIDTVQTYAQQGSFHAFEQAVYAAPEQTRTVEFLKEVSLQTAKDYGYFEAGEEAYYADSWIDISHFFEQPFYVISYCVSNDAAFQIYELEQAEPGAGLRAFEALLPREHDGFLETLSAQSDLESPFAAGRMQKTAEEITRFFAG